MLPYDRVSGPILRQGRRDCAGEPGRRQKGIATTWCPFLFSARLLPAAVRPFALPKGRKVSKSQVAGDRLLDLSTDNGEAVRIDLNADVGEGATEAALEAELALIPTSRP